MTPEPPVTRTDLAQGDDEWWRKAFTQTEYDEMIRAFEEIEAEHEANQENPPVFAAFTDVLQSDAIEVLNFLRSTAQEHQSASVRQFCTAIGHSICMNYMVDVDVEYDEQMTDHATWFGVMDDLMPDDDDDGDDDDYEWIEDEEAGDDD